ARGDIAPEPDDEPEAEQLERAAPCRAERLEEHRKADAREGGREPDAASRLCLLCEVAGHRLGPIGRRCEGKDAMRDQRLMHVSSVGSEVLRAAAGSTAAPARPPRRPPR